MLEFLTDYKYEVVKILHILSIIAWMAGLFYLPRLFVYHADTAIGSETSNLFKIMERRLLKVIMRPAALCAIVFGSLLVWIAGYQLHSFWLEAKITAVVGLLIVHGILESSCAKFGRDERPHSSRYYRVLNEIPTVLLIIIIYMVVMKP